jgi:hypothetical protein
VSATLERRYRRLLTAYPLAYRRERGDELLGTLLELSRPGQRWPALRQGWALLLAGLRMRTGADRLSSTADAWRDSARAALVLMLVWQLIGQLWQLMLLRAELPPGQSISGPTVGGSVATGVLAGAAIVALLAGRHRPGVALALLSGVLSVLPPFNTTWDNLYPFQILAWCLPVTVLAVPLLRRPAAGGPWRWLLAIPLLVLGSALVPLFGPELAAPVIAVVAVAACLIWGALVDPRPAIALGLLFLTMVPRLVVSLSVLVLLVPILLIVGAALITAGGVRARRQPST